MKLWSTLPLTGGDYQRNSEPAWWSSREYTAQILREAAARGMRLDVFLFLSDREASAGAQNAPSAWRGLSVADTAVKVRESAFDTAKYFASQGLNVEVYEIGNEIDFGILKDRRFNRTNLDIAGLVVRMNRRLNRSARPAHLASHLATDSTSLCQCPGSESERWRRTPPSGYSVCSRS